MTTPASHLIARLERDLRAMWDLAPAPGEVPKSRACTMNLVVAGGSRAHTDAYVETLDEVTRSIPARAILVTLDPDAGDEELDGDVAAVCGVGDAKEICSERVRLHARGGACARVGSVVDALRVSELPTVLVWLGRAHVDDPAFESLAQDADRVVVDSAQTSVAGLLAVVEWAGRRAPRPHVADLAWTRLAVWQELCARFFDEPGLRAHAMGITRVTLGQASEPGARLGAEGVLLLGWLATRLGWKASRLGGSLRLRRADGSGVQLGLVVVSGASPAGSVATVGIEAVAAGTTVRGLVERVPSPDADARALTWRLEGGDAGSMEQRVRMRADGGAQLLERTLHRPPNDPALLEAAAFADVLADDGIVCA